MILVRIVLENWENDITAAPVIGLVHQHLARDEDGKLLWLILFGNVGFLRGEGPDLGTLLQHRSVESSNIAMNGTFCMALCGTLAKMNGKPHEQGKTACTQSHHILYYTWAARGESKLTMFGKPKSSVIYLDKIVEIKLLQVVVIWPKHVLPQLIQRWVQPAQWGILYITTS